MECLGLQDSLVLWLSKFRSFFRKPSHSFWGTVLGYLVIPPAGDSLCRSISARQGSFSIKLRGVCMFWSRSQTHCRKRFTELLIGSNVESFWKKMWIPNVETSSFLLVAIILHLEKATRCRQSLDKQILKQAMMQSLRSKVAALQQRKAYQWGNRPKKHFWPGKCVSTAQSHAGLGSKIGWVKIIGKISKWFDRTSSPILVNRLP